MDYADFNAALADLVKVGLAPGLKAHGFKKSAMCFQVRGDQTWGVISVQRWRHFPTGGNPFGTPSELKFTLNTGVASDILTDFFWHCIRKRDKAVPESACDWRARIGRLMPEHTDHWWTIDRRTKLTELRAEVCAAVFDYAVPAVKSCLTTGSLLDRLLAEYAAKEYWNELNIAVLLNAIGDRKRFESFCAHADKVCRGRPSEKHILDGLRRLGWPSSTPPLPD